MKYKKRLRWEQETETKTNAHAFDRLSYNVLRYVWHCGGVNRENHHNVSVTKRK